MIANKTRSGNERKSSDFAKGRKATLQASLNRLERLSSAIRFLGTGVFCCALFAFMLLLGSFVTIYYRGTEGAPSGFDLLISTQMTSTAGLTILFLWDRCKKRGALFHEIISDELEWRYRRMNLTERATTALVEALDENRKPRRLKSVSVRLPLRDFLNSTELPFATPNMSSSVYALWFLFCIFTAIFLLPYLSHHGLVPLAAP